MSCSVSVASDGSLVLLLQRFHFTARNLARSLDRVTSELRASASTPQRELNIQRVSLHFCSFDSQGARSFVGCLLEEPRVCSGALRLCCRHCTGISPLLAALQLESPQNTSAIALSQDVNSSQSAGRRTGELSLPRPLNSSVSVSEGKSVRELLCSLEIHSAGTHFGIPRLCLFGMHNLTSLTLGGCPQLFNPTYLKQLSAAIVEASPPVRRLSLWACNIQLSKQTVICLTRILRALPVEELDLSHNVALLTPHGGLKALPVECADALPLVIRSKSLRSLNLSGVKVTNSKALAKLLWACEATLERLFLVNCSLGPDNIAPIAGSIARMAHLQHFNAADNLLEAQGGLVIAASLSNKAQLKRVLLHRCGLTWEAASGISSMLKTSPLLQLLCLKQNYFHDCGASSIAEGINCATNLLSLSLAENRIGRVGTAALANAAGESKIRHLSLKGNEATAWHAIAEVYEAVSHRAARGQSEAAGMHRLFAWAACPAEGVWNAPGQNRTLTASFDQALADTLESLSAAAEHRPRSIIASAFAPRSVALPPPPMLPSVPTTAPEGGLSCMPVSGTPFNDHNSSVLAHAQVLTREAQRLELSQCASPAPRELQPRAIGGQPAAARADPTSFHRIVHKALSMDIVLSCVLSFWSPGQALHAYPLVVEMPCAPGKHEMLHVETASMGFNSTLGDNMASSQMGGNTWRHASVPAARPVAAPKSRPLRRQSKAPSHAYLLQAMAACGGGRLSGVSSAPRRQCHSLLKAYGGEMTREDFVMRHGSMQELGGSPPAPRTVLPQRRSTRPLTTGTAAAAAGGGSVMSSLEEHPAFPPQ